MLCTARCFTCELCCHCGAAACTLHSQLSLALSMQSNRCAMTNVSLYAMPTRVDNPNRVGSGYIELGPQARGEQVANWQTAAMMAEQPAEVARANPDTVFVNQVFKKSPTGERSCVDLGLADKGGLQEDKCALSFEEMCGYRYLVNVGSNGYANKLKSLFLCGSVVINVESSAPNKEFFEHQLLPGVHYVSVREATDVPRVVREMEENKSRARSIAAAGTRRMAAFNADAVYDYVATVLTEYASRMTFEPKRSPGSFEVSCEDDLYRHYDHDGGMARFLTEDNSTCLDWGKEGAKTTATIGAPGWGGSYDPDEGRIPCEVANDVKEVPDKCPGVRWAGWGKRCARVECAEWMPDET